MKYFISSLMLMSLLLEGCGDDKSTGPAGQGSLYLSRLVISIVPGGTENVAIHATSSDGTTGQCEVSSSDPGIATALVNDSTLVVTGVNYGTTNVTVTNGKGQSCTLPVQVYDYRVLDTGDLLITFTDQFQYIYSFTPPGWDPISLWKPIPPEGYYALGTYARYGADNPNGIAAVMVVKEKPGSNAIAYTNNFEHIGSIVHNPIAPSGYKAMGQVWTPANQTPDPTACIREDLTIAGTAYMFWSYENNYHQSESAWGIYQPDANEHLGAYLAPGTFIYLAGLDGPAPNNPLVNVLKVNLPELSQAPIQEYVPSLPDFNEPSDGFAPKMEKAILVPCTIVKDEDYNNNMPWRIANSPFYRLERQVYYKFIAHYDNHQGSMAQTFDWTINYGISTTQSQTVWGETGVELSAEAGISIYAIEAKVTATVSQSFGYERMNSITELESNSLAIHVNIPPGKAAALWQKYNRFVLYRHNGTTLEPVTSWQFGINSYVMDEYPN